MSIQNISKRQLHFIQMWRSENTPFRFLERTSEISPILFY